MADEYGKEPETALAMLDEAASLLGPDPIIASACEDPLAPKKSRRSFTPSFRE
jgi:hypothetical protein